MIRRSRSPWRQIIRGQCLSAEFQKSATSSSSAPAAIAPAIAGGVTVHVGPAVKRSRKVKRR